MILLPENERVKICLNNRGNTMPLKFGTSGVRGLVTELTDHEVHLFTTAFLIHARNQGQSSPVAISHDLRDSSPHIKTAATQAIHNFGLGTLSCGILPTPALAYYAQQQKCLAMMITGSHIPADRNGIKFYLESGETLKSDDNAIFKIYSELKSQDWQIPTATASEPIDTSDQAKALYQQRYYDFFPTNSLAGYKLLFYQHSSVARDLYPEILERLGAEVIRIGRSDAFIPVDTEAVEAVDTFKGWLREHQADALISTDGDADRPLLVDGSGNVIPGDKIGALASLYLGCEAIALPISCNSGIAKMPNFKKVIQTKIGSPFVVQALNELSGQHKTVGGFEANGGYLLQSDIRQNGRKLDSLPTRDAVLPVLSVLALAKKHSLRISEVTSLLPKIFTSSGLLKNFPTEQSLGILENASKDSAKFFANLLPNQKLTLLNVNTLDGVRCSFQGDMTVHLRPSGNAPEFRCYTEAPTQEIADQLCSDALANLKP
jgi:phosphomannomutase